VLSVYHPCIRKGIGAFTALGIPSRDSNLRKPFITRAINPYLARRVKRLSIRSNVASEVLKA